MVEVLASRMAVKLSVETLLPAVRPERTGDFQPNLCPADGSLSERGVGAVGKPRERSRNVRNSKRGQSGEHGELLSSGPWQNNCLIRGLVVGAARSNTEELIKAGSQGSPVEKHGSPGARQGRAKLGCRNTISRAFQREVAQGEPFLRRGPNEDLAFRHGLQSRVDMGAARTKINAPKDVLVVGTPDAIAVVSLLRPEDGSSRTGTVKETLRDSLGEISKTSGSAKRFRRKSIKIHQ